MSYAMCRGDVGTWVPAAGSCSWEGTRSLRHDAWDPATPPPRLPPTGIVDCFSMLLKPRGHAGGTDAAAGKGKGKGRGGAAE